MTILIKRRSVLQAGMASGFCLLPTLVGATGSATATETETLNKDINVNKLIDALQSIGGPVCLDAANKLETVSADSSGFDLHLRSAGVDAHDARVLANAMQEMPISSTHHLKSFSASYNPDLKDAGAMALSKSFPSTMTELGLVGCSIGDEGGTALLEWAQQAPSLRMICVEGNNFSSNLRSKFAELGRRHTSLLVVA
ncbi:MAG: hypothetical protein AB8B94_18505 [Hyphomicrobiales bacterium]